MQKPRRPPPGPPTRRERFIKNLAEYLVLDQAEKSIRLEMKDPAALLWAELRGATPLFGYSTVNEAMVILERWFNAGMP